MLSRFEHRQILPLSNFEHRPYIGFAVAHALSRVNKGSRSLPFVHPRRCPRPFSFLVFLFSEGRCFERSAQQTMGRSSDPSALVESSVSLWLGHLAALTVHRRIVASYVSLVTSLARECARSAAPPLKTKAAFKIAIYNCYSVVALLWFCL